MKNFCILLYYRFLLGVLFDMKSFVVRIKRTAWNSGIKLQWYRLWIREDEFHSSLEMDTEAMLVMSKKRLDSYLNDLAKRRHIAHERDLMKTSPAFRAMIMKRKKI